MSTDRTGGAPEEDHLIRYRVAAADADTLRTFLAESGADTSCRPVAVRTATGLSVQVLLRRSRVDGVRVDVTVSGGAISTRAVGRHNTAPAPVAS